MSQAEGHRSTAAPRGDLDGRRGELPFALRFDRGRGLLALEGVDLGGLRIDALELDIPGLTFPFDLTAGIRALRDRWLAASRLDVTLGVAAARDALRGSAGPSATGLECLDLAFDRDAVEVTGRLVGTARGSWFALRYLLAAASDQELLLRPGLLVLLGPPDLAMPQIAAAVGRVGEALGLERRGLDLAVTDLPRRVLRALLPSRGFRLPDPRRLRLRSVELGRSSLTLRYASLGAPRSAPTATAAALAEVAELLVPGDEALVAGRPEEARRAYLDALAREPGHPATVERIAWLDAASPSGAEAARAACVRHLASVDHPGLRAVLASVELGAGETRAAVAELERLGGALGPKGRARLLMALGDLALPEDPRSAAMRYEAALEVAPDAVDALEALVRTYAALGLARQVEAAGARLVAALETPAAKAGALADQGELWLHRFDEVERAAGLFEGALAFDPDEPRALLGLAECRAAAGDSSFALRCIDSAARGAAARRLADLEARAHLKAGEIWEATGDLRSAASRYRRASELDPASVPALAGAARADAALGRHALADAGFRRAVLLAEERGDLEALKAALVGLAGVHLDGLGSVEAAIPVVARLRASFPGDPDAEALAARAGLGAEPPTPPPAPAPRPSEVPARRPRGARDTGLPAPPEALATTPAGAHVEGLDDLDDLVTDAGVGLPEDGQEDVEALLEAHRRDPADLQLGLRLAGALEARGEASRLVAVLSTLADNAADDAERAAILARTARALMTGLDDPESAADCLLEAARALGSPAGARHALEAAILLEGAGLDDEATNARDLARRLEGPRDSWDE